MKGFDKFFRLALLVILLCGVGVAGWHISWLHKQRAFEARYEIYSSDRAVYVLDRHARVVYSGPSLFGKQQIEWTASPLP